MSLFTSLHALARTTSINILITAEGDENLRVNVTPMPNGKGEKQRWPLSLLATPEELDAEFAAAVDVYAPGATPLLDQARACAAANQSDAATAPPAPTASEATGTPGKRGRGRPPKAAKADDTNTPPANDGANANATDPRQMRIDDAGEPRADGETPAAETPATAQPASTEQPQSTDAGVDLY